MTMAEAPSSQLLGVLRGERLLWHGRPDANVRFGRNDVSLIPFTVLWAGFAVFWNVMAWRSGAPVFFRIWGLPFLFAGAYLLVGRFLVKKRRKQRTEYALTATRAIVCDSRGSIRDVPLASTSVEQTRSRDGRHLTVTFGFDGTSGRSVLGRRQMPPNSGLDGFGSPVTPGFFDVADVAGLEAGLAQIVRG